MKKITTVSAFLGTLIEVYDFSVFPFLIPVLAKVFFSEAQNSALNLTTLAYVVSYYIKPLGAIGFGYLTDRYGRKKTLLSSTVLMTLATMAIALLPPNIMGMYFGAGLIICRIIQGLSISGEFSAAIIMSVEESSKSPAFTGSFSFVGGSLGLLLANLTVYILLYSLPHEQIILYAWRIPFLMGGLGCVVLLLIRNKIDCTTDKLLTSSRYAVLFKDYKKELLLTFIVSSLSASAFYITFIFMPTYLSALLKLHSHQQSILITLFALLLYLITLPLGGILADRIGVIRQIKLSSLLYLFSSYIVFALIPQINTSFCIMVLILFALIQALLNSALPVFIVKQFQLNQRGKALAISYNISLTLFAGIMPYWLLTSENHPNPGIPISICAVLSLLALHFQRKRNGYLRSEFIYK